MSIQARAYVALVLATILWASLPPASKAVLAGIGPGQVSLVRGLSAWLVLMLLALAVYGAGEFKQGFRHLKQALALGVVSFVLSSLLAMVSLVYIPASVQSVITAMNPIWVALAAVFTAGAPLRVVLGSIIALLGVGVVLLGSGSTDLGTLHPIGVILTLINSGVIALSNVIARSSSKHTEPLTFTAIAAGSAVPFLIVIAATQGGIQPILNASLPTQLGLLYVGVACTAMNFGLWFWGLKYVAPAQAAPIMYLSPPIAVLLSWGFLGEALTINLGTGMLLILFGISLTQNTSWIEQRSKWFRGKNRRERTES